MLPLFRQFFDNESSTFTYLVADVTTRKAMLIDPVRENVERDLRFVRELGLTLAFAFDTHVHADHVTALGELRSRTGAQTIVSSLSNAECADRHVAHNDVVAVGGLAFHVRATPGHTNGCLSLVAEDKSMAFTGDALLIRGCGRTDFQEGNASTLWRSVHEQIFTLPETTSLYPAHDYCGRMVTTVAEERAYNPRFAAKSEAEFIYIMNNLLLAPPQKMAEAVPLNRNCGIAP